MGPLVEPVIADAVQPASTDVVIIGGGIIGVTAALSLAERGIATVLLEKGHIAGEQSSRNWGWCRQAGRDEREMPLITESLRLWREMDRQIGQETGYTECGVLYIGETEEDERGFAEWMAMAAPYQVGARMVRGAELAALLPGAARTPRCGLHVPSDGRAEPQKAAPAIARAAQAKGAVILAPCAARGLETTGGRVSGVVTEHGRIGCSAVILAGGAWSSLFCASLGIRLPQLKVLSTVLRTTPLAGGPESCAWSDKIGYRKRADGGYTIAYGTDVSTPVVPDSLRYLREFAATIRRDWKSVRPKVNAQSLFEASQPRRWALDRESPFEKIRVLDPPPNRRKNALAMAEMRALFPAFAGAQIVQEWAGYIDVAPDVVPYIGEAGGLPGLVVATGFSGHGFGIGPAAGRAAAAIATGATPASDLTAFRLDRFADGSPITLGAEI